MHYRRHLRSASDRRCIVPRTQNTFGDRNFCVAGPRVWNRLPGCLRREDIQLQTIQTAAEIMFVCLGTLRLRHFVTNLLLGALQIFFIIIIIILLTPLTVTGVKHLAVSVCVSVCTITQKTNDPKV